jgi:hypothetical protein
MANRPKQKGTAAETAIVNALIEEGWVHAERRTLSGAADKGDVKLGDGIPVMVEAKNCGDGLDTGLAARGRPPRRPTPRPTSASSGSSCAARPTRASGRSP